MDRTLRTFLAIPLDGPTRRSIEALQQKLQEKIQGVRWTDPGKVHLTLRFFGDTDQETLEKISSFMLSVERSIGPFAVHLDGLGAFPVAGKARVIWVGFREDVNLTTLYRCLNEGLSRIGVIPGHKSFIPHLTLGRLRQPADLRDKLLLASKGYSPPTMWVDRLIYYESHLHSTGAIHTPLTTVSFTSND